MSYICIYTYIVHYSCGLDVFVVRFLVCEASNVSSAGIPSIEGLGIRKSIRLGQWPPPEEWTTPGLPRQARLTCTIQKTFPPSLSLSLSLSLSPSVYIYMYMYLENPNSLKTSRVYAQTLGLKQKPPDTPGFSSKPRVCLSWPCPRTTDPGLAYAKRVIYPCQARDSWVWRSWENRGFACETTGLEPDPTCLRV